MVKLKALKAFSYAQRFLKIGDDFDALEKDVRILTAIGNAKIIKDVEGDIEPKAKATYKRKDLNAEK